MRYNKDLLIVLAIIGTLLSGSTSAADQGNSGAIDLVVNDAARDRAIPILVYIPKQKQAAPVVLFSHGLGGSRHRVILALGTAFWDAYLRGDANAKAWLDGDGPGSVLEKQDQWQLK